MIAPLAEEERALTFPEKERCLAYLATQWAAIQTINAQAYFRLSHQNPYRVNIALAKLLFPDEEVLRKVSVAHEIAPSFHCLLIPTTSNVLSVYGEQLPERLSELYFLDGYIVSHGDMVISIQMQKQFCNPFDTTQALPDWVIAKLFESVDKKIILDALQPALIQAKDIPPATLAALYETLLPACHANEDFAAAHTAFLAFRDELALSMHSADILSLQNHATEETIGMMIAKIEEPDASWTCLSETASNICHLLRTTRHLLDIAKRYLHWLGTLDTEDEDEEQAPAAARPR